MITILNDTAVAVDTFTDLKDVLQGSNYYTTVYLAADITMTAGIAILANKSEIIIDGRFPATESGVVHTLTDHDSSSATHTLGIRSASAISMTVRNMNIVGRNYYGILYVPDGTAYSGVTVTYQNVTYSGPQITYHAYGRTRYIDCDITICDGYSPNNEVGEVERVEIGGKTTITQTSNLYPLFWFRGGSAPSLTVLEGAEVMIFAGNDGIVADRTLPLIIERGASLCLHLQKAVGRDASDRFSRILVDESARLHIEQNSNSGYPTLYCDGAFTVNEGAEVYIGAEYTGSPVLLYYNETGGSLTLNNPRSFVLYRGGGQAYALTCRTVTDVRIRTGQYNQWIRNTEGVLPGGLDDIPPYTWRKADDAMLELNLEVSANVTLKSHNLTAEELAVLPAISMILPNIVRVISLGDLPLKDVLATDDGLVSGQTADGANVRATAVVGGANHTVDGQADAQGRFLVAMPEGIMIGTIVKYLANTPFLFTDVQSVAVWAGELKLETVPVSLPFVLEPISTDPVRYGREDAAWSLTLLDTRARGGEWFLYGAVDGPMVGQNPAHTVPGSLIFVDERGDARPLGAYPICIASGYGLGSAVPITVSWPRERGMLMRPGSAPFYNGERYTATVLWTLSEEPLDGEEER